MLILEADAGDLGTIEAAKEAQAKGNTDLRVISWVKDKNYLAPDLVIGGWRGSTSATWNMSSRRSQRVSQAAISPSASRRIQ